MDLTVATWNLYLGADVALLLEATTVEELAVRVDVLRDQLARTSFRDRAGAVATLLRRERVDVVGLQEVSRWTVTSEQGETEVVEDFLPVLLAALERAGAPYDVHAVTRSFEGGLPVDGAWMSVAGSNVVLVRRDAGLRVVDEETGTYAAELELRTGIAGVSFPVVRGWGRVDVERDGHRVRVVNTHTEAYDAAVRDAQRDELLATVGDPGVPVVLLGDLNATPDAVGLPSELRDAWRAAGGDPAGGLTCGQDGDLSNPVSALRERIDYVFVRDASVRGCRVVGADPADRTVGGLWPSDHAAVVADLHV